MGSNDSEPKFAGKQPSMLYSRLGDDGKFEPEKGVITKFPGLDGGGSVAADDKGNVYVAWHAPDMPRGGESTRRVFVAKSKETVGRFRRKHRFRPKDSAFAAVVA